MKPLSHLVAALGASLALLCCHGSVMAAATAAATISDVRFGVLDLTPDDGIAAGYDIDQFSAYVLIYMMSPTEFKRDDFVPDPYQPATLRFDRGPTFVQAHVGGAIGELASSAALHPNVGTPTVLGVSSRQSVWLTLRPYTVFTVSGHFSLGANYALDGEQYFASGLTEAAIHYEQSGNNSATSIRTGVTPGGPTQQEADENFLLTFRNDSALGTQVVLELGAFTDVSAIPEPGTLSMLGAGLVVVGAVARRRRRD